MRTAIVTVDSAILDEVRDPRVELLLGLLADSSLIKSLRYGDDGPPPDVERTESLLGTAATGWITFVPTDGQFCPGIVLTTDGNGCVSQTVAGSSDALALAEGYGKPLYGASLGAERERRRADAIAGFAAEAADSDLFITRRKLLLDQPFPLTRGLASAEPEKALPIVGLYLRTQEEFIVARDPAGRFAHTYNRGLFYWVAARDQLPAGWRWMSACVHADKDNTLTWLAGSLHQRVQRALKARDRVHAALLVPQQNDTAEEALAELDVMLVSLMGAFDAAARVAHLVLGLAPDSIYKAAWQKQRWRRQWSILAPELDLAVTAGSVGHDVLAVLRSLRNTVHGEALQPLAISESSISRREDTLVGLPVRERQVVLDSLDRLGGAATWGVRDLMQDRSHADIRVLVEHLLPASILVLNELLRLTPVERLGVDTSGDAFSEPTGSDSPFAEQIRLRIRWQLGLPDPTYPTPIASD